MSANVGENASPFVDQLADGPGVSRIDPTDPAAPMYRLLALMRSPVALRDLMLQPVRTGYIGQEKPIDPAELPKSGALSRHLRVRAGCSIALGPHSLSGIQSAGGGGAAGDDALRARRRIHARAVGGHRLHHEQDCGGKRDGGGQRQLPPRTRVAVPGVSR